MDLQKLLERELQNATGSFGVAVTDLSSGEQASIQGNELFQMASTFKIPILAALLNEVEKGNVVLDEKIKINEDDFVTGSGVIVNLHQGITLTIKDLAMLMIIVSDNIATDYLLNRIGKNVVSEYIDQLELKDIYINQTCKELLCTTIGVDPNSPNANEKLRQFDFTVDTMLKDNIVFKVNEHGNASTPLAMNQMLVMLEENRLLTGETRTIMRDIMLKQQFNGRIPYKLPGNIMCAHKTGTVGDVVNDAGIVYLPNNKGSFAISIFSKNNKTVSDGEDMIAQLTKVVYDYLLEKSK